jgi:formylglycine-generating enzyme required for sulfatase activity
MLPRELEREKASAGGMDTPYPRGDGERSLPLMANVPESGIGSLSVCGCFPPDACGLYDMSGNGLEGMLSFYAPCAASAFDGAGAQPGVKGCKARWGGEYNIVKADARLGRQTHSVFRCHNQGFRSLLRSAVFSPQVGAVRRDGCHLRDKLDTS